MAPCVRAGQPLFSISRCCLFLMVLLPVIISGCTNPPERLIPPKAPPAVKIQDGFEIPVFSSAMGQLNYARSGFTDKREKKAAFRAVLDLFPRDIRECGHASIGLAYLHLEPDYRFASPKTIRRAAVDFNSVLDRFAGQPDVVVKAHWYLGWIYTELMDEPEKGLVHFWRIVREFPDAPVSQSPPVPWVNLVSPPKQTQDRKHPQGPEKLWAEVALLEIIRNTPDHTRAALAFDHLAERFPAGAATGFALKFMLTDPGLANHALPRVAPYLSQYTENPYLIRDIRMLAQKASP